MLEDCNQFVLLLDSFFMLHVGYMPLIKFVMKHGSCTAPIVLQCATDALGLEMSSSEM